KTTWPEFQPSLPRGLPGAHLSNCLRHAINKLPGKLTALAAPVCKALRSQFHTLWYRARQRKGLRVFALGQRLRHFADHVAATVVSQILLRRSCRGSCPCRRED